MRMLRIAAITVTAVFGLAACSESAQQSEDLTVSATAAAMDASDAGDAIELGASSGGGLAGGGTMMGLHCDADPEISTVELCGRSFPTTAHFEWTSCAERPQASSGTVDITTTVSAEPEGTCDAETILRVERELSYATERARRDGSTMAASGSTSSTSENALGATTRLVSRTMDVQREMQAADGTSLGNVHVTGTLEVTVDTSALPVTRTFDGTLAVEQDGGEPVAMTLTEVVRVHDCYAPVSGTVVRMMTDGSEHTLVYGPACGEATLDGEPITVYPYGGGRRRSGR